MERLADKFYKVANENSDKVAIICEGKEVSYSELSKLVSKCSNLFIENDIKYGECIGIPMTNSIESVIIMLAAANNGITLVPINPSLPMGSVKRAFEIADVKHIIGRSNFINKYNKEDLFKVEGKVISLDKEVAGCIFLKDIANYSSERTIVSDVCGDESYIITMTSGSTGDPKPINLTQKNKVDRSKAHIELYNLNSNDRIMAATPLYHSLAERLVLLPLILGATSILISRFTPESWLKAIEKFKVTFTIAVSAQLSQVQKLINKTNEFNIESLRCVVSSSALLEEEVKNKLVQRLECDFHEMYGTSEVSTVTNINITESKTKNKSVGRRLKEAKIKILDDSNNEVAFGEIGEISCKSSLVCNGYYKNDDKFSESIINGYFKTGDLGYLDEDGYLYFMGRKKELIITGGINVYPPDIENCIKILECVKECAAFAYPDERLGEVVAVAIVLYEDSNLSDRNIKLHCARNLADFQQPHELFFLKELPKNPMGKIVKGKLLEAVNKI